jgi:hypothetical protein
MYHDNPQKSSSSHFKQLKSREPLRSKLLRSGSRDEGWTETNSSGARPTVLQQQQQTHQQTLQQTLYYTGQPGAPPFPL